MDPGREIGHPVLERTLRGHGLNKGLPGLPVAEARRRLEGIHCPAHVSPGEKGLPEAQVQARMPGVVLQPLLEDGNGLVVNAHGDHDRAEPVVGVGLCRVEAQRLA